MKTTITKTQTAPARGDYQSTSIDSYRDNADIVITGYIRNRTEFRSNRKLSGPGIKMASSANGSAVYLATEEAMTEIRRRYTVATDF